jgi:hypothetical protein
MIVILELGLLSYLSYLYRKGYDVYNSKLTQIHVFHSPKVQKSL